MRKWRGMKMRGVLKVLGFFVSLGLVVGGFFNFSYGASPEITLRYAGDLPMGNHLTRGQEFFAKRVDEITKGRVESGGFSSRAVIFGKRLPQNRTRRRRGDGPKFAGPADRPRAVAPGSKSALFL